MAYNLGMGLFWFCNKIQFACRPDQPKAILCPPKIGKAPDVLNLPLSPCRILFCNQKPALLCAQNYPVLCYQYYGSNLLCIIDSIVTADITNEGEEDEEEEEEEEGG